MNDIYLSKLQSYQAMFFFLENLYEKTNDDNLADFLESMQLLKDGSHADPAYWKDWEDAVSKVVDSGNVPD